MKYKIPYANPYIDEKDVEAVATAVREKRLSQGEYVARFEKKFSEYLGCDHAVATMNGTAALHLAVSALDIKEGDEIIVPSFTHITTANCALYVRAKPVFVDIEDRTLNIDPEKIEEAVGDKTKAIIVVHYGGQTADMDPILKVARKYGLHVVEDSTEAHGSTYKNRMAGTLGDVSCFSFYPNKNITTGEGGMLVTNDSGVAERARILRKYGQDSRFHHVVLGYNYKMMDLQGALGLVQLNRLDWILEKKKKAAEYYNKLLSDISDIEIPYVMPDVTHTYMFYTVKFPEEGVRDRVKQHLEDVGVETAIAFPPVHLQPLYRNLFGYKEGYLPVTEDCSKKVLCLPMFSEIRREDQEFIVNSVLEAI